MSPSPETQRSILFWRLLLGMVVLIAWEWSVRNGLLDSFFFSRPSDIGLRVWGWMCVGHDLAAPAHHVRRGGACRSPSAGCSASVLGFALARTPFLAAVLEPYIRVANALPRVVLAPIFLLWFGLGIWSKVALGVTVVFFIVFFNTYRGVREVDRVMIDNARMLGASRRATHSTCADPERPDVDLLEPSRQHRPRDHCVVVGEYLGASRGIGYTDRPGGGRVRHDRRVCRNRRSLGGRARGWRRRRPHRAAVAKVEA